LRAILITASVRFNFFDVLIVAWHDASTENGATFHLDFAHGDLTYHEKSEFKYKVWSVQVIPVPLGGSRVEGKIVPDMMRHGLVGVRWRIDSEV
jgi:hypothetical protein